MSERCVCCGTTERSVLADGYGFSWCGVCHARTQVEIELGIAMLERYLTVNARHDSVLDRIREYTDGGTR